MTRLVALRRLIPLIAICVITSTVVGCASLPRSSEPERPAPLSWSQSRQIELAVAKLLVEERFAELNSVLDTALEQQIRVVGGFFLYNRLISMLEGEHTYQAPTLRWLEVTPEKHYPYLVLAVQLKIDGAHFRGSGFAPTITESGQRLYQAAYAEAQRLLDRAQQMEPNDPVVAAEQIDSIMRASADIPAMFQQLARARAYSPDYATADFRLITALLPRWRGKPGAAFAFAVETASTAAPGTRRRLAVGKLLREERLDLTPELVRSITEAYEAHLVAHPDSPSDMWEFANVLARMGGDRARWEALAIEAKNGGVGWDEDAKASRQSGSSAREVEVRRYLLDLLETGLGPRHPALCPALEALASALTRNREYTEAEQVALRAQALAEETIGPDSIRASQARGVLGYVYTASRQSAKAIPVLLEELEYRVETYGADYRLLADTYNGLGASYGAIGDYSRSKLFHELEAQLTAATEGTQATSYASALLSLGTVAMAEGRYGDAVSLLKECLDVRRRAYKQDHVEIALSLNLIGDASRLQGELGVARAYLEDSIAMRSRVLPAGHPHFAASRKSLGAQSLAEGRLDDARRELHLALEIYVANGGDAEDGARTEALLLLANVERLAGNHSRAGEHLESASQIREKRTEPDSIPIGECELERALLAAARGARKQSAAHMERATAIYSGRGYPEHPSLLDARRRLRAAAVSAR